MDVKALAQRRVHTGQRQSDDAQRSAQQVVQQVNAFPFMRGVLLDAEAGQPDGSGLSFTAATARSIVHGLGRKAMGFFEVYGADVASVGHVGLCATAHPTGVSSLTHVTVTPAATGKCFLFVF